MLPVEKNRLSVYYNSAQPRKEEIGKGAGGGKKS
jgi:hypothetical protein